MFYWILVVVKTFSLGMQSDGLLQAQKRVISFSLKYGDQKHRWTRVIVQHNL